MKKFYLFLVGFCMILMSCENVQEKSEQFKQDFNTAIKNGKFDDAERIANDAQAYYEGLSDSGKKKYEECAPKFMVILAAKKFNKRFKDTCATDNPTKTLKLPTLDKIAKEAKQYMTGLDQQDAEIFNSKLIDFETEITNLFKQDFNTAIKNGKFDDAERIANDAQAYHEGLSDSGKKKYEECAPKFMVILAAKKFNKRFKDACATIHPTMNIELPILNKIAEEAKQYMTGLDQQDAEIFNSELIDFEAKIIEYRAIFFTTNVFNALKEGDEEAAQGLANLADFYLKTLNARLQKVYEKKAKKVAEALIKSIK